MAQVPSVHHLNHRIQLRGLREKKQKKRVEGKSCSWKKIQVAAQKSAAAMQKFVVVRRTVEAEIEAEIGAKIPVAEAECFVFIKNFTAAAKKLQKSKAAKAEADSRKSSSVEKFQQLCRNFKQFSFGRNPSHDFLK
ncbi:hypothetical protein M9H77_16622 [Catharanthus roseus]|uniref:Uncharacterized protein n=1 Tax=Catharanthus roseus TaxID=4058 RepID=A0ACC0B298_CATRO|nr:hypothetical protein M9H77_16622 [Catharanthus roseus]